MNFIVAHFQEVHQVMIVLKEAFALQLQNIPGFSSGELVEVSFSFYLIKRESCLVLYFFFFTGKSSGDFVTFFDRILGNEFSVLFLNSLYLFVKHFVICNDLITGYRFFPFKVYFKIGSKSQL